MNPFRFIVRHLWLSLLTLIVLLAAAIVALHLLLPQAGRYRQEIAELIGSHLGRPVTIEGLDMAWLPGGPALQLFDVGLLDDRGERELLRLNQLYLSWDFYSLLSRGQLRVGRFTVSGIRIQLRRDEQGRLSVEGLGTSGGTAGAETAGLAAWLLGQPRLGLLNSEVVLRDQPLGRELRFANVNLELANEGRHHRLSGSLNLPPLLGEHLILVAEFDGELMRPAQWQGRFYLRGDHLRLGEELELEALRRLGVAGAAADLELWSHWSGGNLVRWSARINDGGVALRPVCDAQGHCPEVGENLNGLRGNLYWRGHRHGWMLNGEELSLRYRDHAWPAGGVSLVYADDDAGRAVIGNFDHAEVAALTALLRAGELIDGEQQQLLDAIRPGGRFREVRFELSQPQEGEPHYRASGRFEGLELQAWKGAPALSGISGEFRGDERRGLLALKGRGVVVELPQLFRDPLELARLEGELHWRREGERLLLDAPDLVAVNRDIATRTRLRLEQPLAGGAPFLDLHTVFADGDATRTPHYLPARIMPPQAVAWLDRAFRGGRVTGGGLVVHGPLAEFPFDQGQGRFEVAFDAEDVTLDYGPGWPVLEQLDAHARFFGRGFRAEGQGRIMDGRVERVAAEIPDLMNARLAIEGRAASEVPELLKLVRETPLTDSVGRYFEGVSGDGAAELALNLDLPFDGGGENRAWGAVDFSGAGLGLKEWELALEGLHGRVDFDGDGLKAEGLRASLWGRPLKLEIHRLEGGGSEFDARARLDGVELARRYLEPLAPLVQGDSDWRVRVQVPAGEQGRVTLLADSTLAGTRLELPAPLGKEAAGRQPLELRIPLGGKGLDGPIRFRYGQLLAGRFLASGRPWRGAFRLGEGDAPPLPDAGVAVSGRLAELSLAPWQDLLDRLAPAEGHGAPLPPVQLDLELGRLVVAGHDLGAVAVAGRRDAAGLELQLDGPGAKGRISVASGEAPVTAEFEHLVLGPALEEEGRAEPDPRRLPEIHLNTRRLGFDGLELGSAQLDSHPTGDGLHAALRSEAESFQLSGELDWRMNDAGAVSTLDARLRSEDMGRALAALGYANTMEQGVGGFEGHLTWPGGPGAFSLAGVDGQLSIDLRKGRFLELSPGAGRIFGLLSIQTLTRRLTLDFSDLFGKGFTFDDLAGNFHLMNGVATARAFTIDGPAARLEISGDTDLVNQTFQQEVSVTPHVSGTLPLAGALAGGPGVGAVLLIAEKLFSSRLDRIGSFRYKVAGPWSDPVLERVTDEPAAGGG